MKFRHVFKGVLVYLAWEHCVACASQGDVIVREGNGGISGGGGAGGINGGLGGENPGGGAQWPESPPTEMIEVCRSVGCFKIDVHEVTRAQYTTFLRSFKAFPTQVEECSANVSLDGCQEGGPDANYPETCSDWCDARAYCEWAGKRLCRGEKVDVGGANHVGYSEWFAACMGSDSSDPPSDKFCKLASHIGPVDITPKCVGNVSGIFNLLGNAFEWTDECIYQNSIPDAGLFCLVRGDGACFSSIRTYYADTEPEPGDAWPFTAKGFGFRCCK